MAIRITRYDKDYLAMTRPQLIKELADNRCGEYILKINEIERTVNELIKQGDASLIDKFDETYRMLSDIEKQVKQKYDNLIGILEALTKLQERAIESLVEDIVVNDCKDVRNEQRRISQIVSSINELKLKIIKKTETMKSLTAKDIGDYDWKVFNRIKDVLNEKGIDQNWLVDKLGMDRSTVSSLLNNKTMTTMSNAFKIAYLLDTTISDLFYTDGQLVWAKLVEDDIEQLFNTKEYNYDSDEIQKLLNSSIDDIEKDDFCMPQTEGTETKYNVKNKIELIIEGDKLSSDKIEEYFNGKGKIKKVSIEYEEIDNQQSISNMGKELDELIRTYIEFKNKNNKA